MKSYKLYTTGAIAIAALLLVSSCKKNLELTIEEDFDYSNKAKVQVLNAAIGVQRNYLFMDGKTLSGGVIQYTQTNATNSAYLGSGVTFAIAPGLHGFMLRDTLATSTQPALAFSEDFQANKSYTVFFYDTLTAVKQITVENQIEVPTDSTARIRFANFVFVKGGLPGNVDVFSKALNANIYSDIPVKDVTGFMPYRTGRSFLNTSVTDSLIVRAAGTMNALDTATVTFIPTRSYTLLYRGRSQTNGALNTFIPRTLTSNVTF